MITGVYEIMLYFTLALLFFIMIEPALYYCSRKLKEQLDENIDPRMNTYYQQDTSIQYLQKRYKVMCSGVIYGKFHNKQEACRWATMHLKCNWYIEEYNQYISLYEYTLD